MSQEAVSFPSAFDHAFAFGPEARNSGTFGRNVLDGLIRGIDEFRIAADGRYGSRSLGPAMLGAFLWLDDPPLLERIAQFPSVCVVINKQERGKRQQERLDKLRPVVQHGSGFPARALPELEDLVPRQNGAPPYVGPSLRAPHVELSTLRTIGYRKGSARLVPILHTKMVLLGDLWWHDEDALGHVADVIGFTARRLWVGSANGTSSSRENLEFGLWLDDPTLLKAARRFLAHVLKHSEDLDPDAHAPEPSLVEPDYDDEAFAEYADMELVDEDDA